MQCDEGAPLLQNRATHGAVCLEGAAADSSTRKRGEEEKRIRGTSEKRKRGEEEKRIGGEEENGRRGEEERMSRGEEEKRRI